eukprot:Gb_02913 [translate_table: standard]
MLFHLWQTLSDEDLEALISDEVACGTLGLSTGTVKLIGPDGEEHIACAVGTGPVDAAYKAVDSIVKVCYRLLIWYRYCLKFSIDLPPFCSAFSYISRTFSGIGAGTDIVVSSVQAYINALNKILGFRVGSMEKTSGKVPNVFA